nr:hypothetical protein [Bacillus velezensis]
FDEPQRFHGTALPVLSRSPRKRGAFSPSDVFLLAPYRDRRPHISFSCSQGIPSWSVHKKPAPGRFRNPAAPQLQ